MEMMQAPTPFMIEKDVPKIIKIDDLKVKETYKFKEYVLTIGLLEENIAFISSTNKSIYQTLKNYEAITKEIPNFKLYQNIDSIYKLFTQLFSSNRYELKKDEENKLKLRIKLKDILGNDENHEILLDQKN